MRKSLIIVSAIVVVMGAPLAVAKNVLWDTSHSSTIPFDYYTQYQNVIQHLNTQNYNIDRNTGDLLNVDLGAYDAIVVSVLTTQNSAYTTGEVAKISDFINNGGGLLIMGDNSMSPNANIQPIASAFGAWLGWTNPASVPLGYDQSNQVLQGITDLHFQGAGELQLLGPSSEIVWVEDVGGNKSLVAVAEFGMGDVITIGDADMMTNNYYDQADNLIFVENTFLHLTTPEPATAIFLGLGSIALIRRKKQ